VRLAGRTACSKGVSSRLPTPWCGLEAVPEEDVLDGAAADLMAKVTAQ
jgi:hypothetical protein